MQKQQIQEELAWAAGFIDGEGHFGLHVTKGRPTDTRQYASPELTVAQCDRRSLDRLQKILGLGVVGGPYKKDNEKWRASYLFYITGLEKTEKAAKLVWCWLGEVKQEQATKTFAEYHEFRKRPRLPMGPKPRATVCHPERKHFAKGLCTSCYQTKWRRNEV